MPDDAATDALFARLASLFAPFRPPLVAVRDDPGDLYLETPPSAAYPKGFYFGAVKTGKRYISYHLMPVYVHPDLLERLSPELRRRMQGKSCFNFTRPDEALLAELGQLTAAGFARFQSDGLVPGD